MLARYGYARWMNDVGFDVAGGIMPATSQLD
jgi:hypothetical protein